MSGIKENQKNQKHALNVEAHIGTVQEKKRNKRHGKSRTPLYKLLYGMRDRCSNKNSTGYKDYGARGISVCDKWLSSFEEFEKWALENNYKKGLEIDRIDNDRNYEPINCRFVTRQENLINKAKVEINVNMKLAPFQLCAIKSMLARKGVWICPTMVSLPDDYFLGLHFRGICESRLNPKNNTTYQYCIP